MSATEGTYRRPWLTARQVAVAAVFGGLGFVFNALKITIPGYLPGITFGFDGLWLVLSTMIGGPIVGLIVCFLFSLPGDIGLWGWFGYAIHVIVLSLLYPTIYRRMARNNLARMGVFVAWNEISLLIQVWYFTALYAWVFQIMPFWPLMAFNMTYPLLGFSLIYNLIPAILLMVAPKMMEPDWSWSQILRR